MSEDLREIPGWNKYFARADGVIISTKGALPRALSQFTKTPKLPYLAVNLHQNNKDSGMLVHQLICTAFHGTRPTPKHQVRHLDGNGRNNNASNLAWGTKLENEHDKDMQNRRPLGETCVTAKLTNAEVRVIRRLAEMKVTGPRIGRIFNCSKTTVARIVRRKAWKSVA